MLRSQLRIFVDSYVDDYVDDYVDGYSEGYRRSLVARAQTCSEVNPIQSQLMFF